MAIVNSFQRSTPITFTLSKELSSSRGQVSLVQSSINNIGRTIERNTKIKKDLVFRSSLLESRRREASKRREMEDALEASRVSTSPAKGLSVAQSSGKGPLGRILTFLGFLGAGWILENLPTWIAMGKAFIERTKLAIDIMSGFVGNVWGVLKSFGGLLKSVGQNVITLDLTDTSDRIKNSFDELNSTMETLGSQIEDGFKTLMAPLGIEIPGLSEDRPDSSERPESPASEGGAGGAGTTPPPSPGQRYNISQLVGLAQRVGFKGENAAIAAAIAMAESGGRTNAHNPKYPDNSYGLWQINMLDVPGYMLGEERRKQFNLKSNEQLFDPNLNATIAYKISGGSNFSAWSTYPKAMQPFLQEARKALKNPQPIPSTPSVTSGGNRQSAQPNKPSGTAVSGKIYQYLHGEPGRAGYEPKGHWNHDHFSFTSRAAAVKAFLALKSKGFQPYEFEGYGRKMPPDSHSPSGGHFGPAGGKPTYSDETDGTAFDIPYSSYGSGPIGPNDYKKSREAHKIVLSALGQSGGSTEAESQPATPSAQISSTSSSSAPGSEITPERRGQEIILVDSPRPSSDAMGSGISASSTTSGSSGGVSQVTKYDMLNNFIKNKLLLDLAYL